MAGIRALLGLFPKTGDYEGRRNQLEEEYNDLLAFKSSKELRDFHALESEVNSEAFNNKKKEILSLKYKATDDYQKEKAFLQLKKAKDIKLYYKVKDSEQLKRFKQVEQSKELARHDELKAYIESEEYLTIKKEASQSAKQKFAQTDLAKTLEQFTQQKNSEALKGYFKFVNNKLYPLYKQAVDEDLPAKVEAIEDKKEQKALLKSKSYKAYSKLAESPFLKYYEQLHDSDELEAYVELEKFVTSDDFKKQRKEIESKNFKDTEAYIKLQEYNGLKKSADIVFFQKFMKSKDLQNFLKLDGSDRIKEYEEAEAYMVSDAFIKFKDYCLKSPKKRWAESKEYEVFQDYELQKKSEKIVWYHKNIDHKRFDWHRSWSKTFSDEFSAAKLDAKKWLTRYYYGDKMLNTSYSLSVDKHFVTDDKNISLDNGRLHIVTKKEEVKGKSWDEKFGFTTKTFQYTSGLVNTAESFRQQYGIFEAKIKVSELAGLQQSFYLLGKKRVPHVSVAAAGKKLCMGTYWGDAGDSKSIQKFIKKRGRSKFASDYFIYTLEWQSGKLIWKINGVEVASTTKGLPEEPLYLVFSAGLQSDLNGALPAEMDVDWVRCYQSNERIAESKA